MNYFEWDFVCRHSDPNIMCCSRSKVYKTAKQILRWIVQNAWDFHMEHVAKTKDWTSHTYLYAANILMLKRITAYHKVILKTFGQVPLLHVQTEN